MALSPFCLQPAYCALASLSMVLNALSIDPRRTWKGAWRWFHEEMLDCCWPLEQVCDAFVRQQCGHRNRKCGANVGLHTLSIASS